MDFDTEGPNVRAARIAPYRGHSPSEIKVAAFAVLLVVIGATYVALTRTWIGRAAFAYAQNPEAAALMGVKLTACRRLSRFIPPRSRG